MGCWISTAARYLDVIKICQVNLKIGCIKSARKQTIYNYKNLYKLMRLAPKLLNCKVNMTFFVKNHKILLIYFEEN